MMDCLKCVVFIAWGGGGGTAPNASPNARPEDVPKAVSPGLSEGVHGCVSVVSSLQCV